MKNYTQYIYVLFINAAELYIFNRWSYKVVKNKKSRSLEVADNLKITHNHS